MKKITKVVLQFFKKTFGRKENKKENFSGKDFEVKYLKRFVSFGIILDKRWAFSNEVSYRQISFVGIPIYRSVIHNPELTLY